MTSGFSTQAYMWWGIYDGQHQKIVKLEKELVRTQERLRLKEQECYEASWTLQELTNGAGRAAMNLTMHAIAFKAAFGVQRPR